MRSGVHRRLLTTDALALGVAAAIGIGIGMTAGSAGWSRWAVALLVVLWWLLLWRGSRDPDVLGAGVEEYRRLAESALWAFLWFSAVALVLHTFVELGWDAADVVWTLAAGLVLLTAGRWWNRRWLGHRAASGEALHRVLLVSCAERAEHLIAQLDRHPAAGYRLVCQLPVDALEDPRAIVAAAVESGADTLVLSPGADAAPQQVRQLGWQLEGTAVSLLLDPSLVEVAGPRLSVHPAEGLALIRLDDPHLSRSSQFLKRSLDLVGAVLGLIVLGLPMLVLALLVRRDSEGPALFAQQRAGREGQVFTCYKFRTMAQGSDAQRESLRALHGNGGATFKLADDPRVTRLGAVLRKYSIDELPQLLNVLQGSMSLVGPRPHPLDDVARYDELAHRRLAVKPGMTGLWQVSGRSDLDWDESLMIDLRYVDNWSVTLDLALLAKTVSVVARGRGAY